MFPERELLQQSMAVKGTQGFEGLGPNSCATISTLCNPAAGWRYPRFPAMLGGFHPPLFLRFPGLRSARFDPADGLTHAGGAAPLSSALQVPKRAFWVGRSAERKSPPGAELLAGPAPSLQNISGRMAPTGSEPNQSESSRPKVAPTCSHAGPRARLSKEQRMSTSAPWMLTSSREGRASRPTLSIIFSHC